jgi:hypothetical protein
VKRLLSIALSTLVCCGALAEPTAAKGVEMGAPEGVTVAGSAYRYVAISPRIPRPITVVGRIDRQGGQLSRSWYLRGRFQVPAVAYDLSPGGLSADGGTLVLGRVPNQRVYPPRISRFAILDTQRSFRWRGPGRPPRFRRFADFVDLRGHFVFDAISPDGSTVYLIHHHLPLSAGGAYITNYEVRALDVKSGKLLPRPIVDPNEPEEQMRGLPVTRAASPDGRWAYTLYDGGDREPFIHALDTVGRRAVCIDLPQLGGRHNTFMLWMRVARDGRQLTVLSNPPPVPRSRLREEGVPVSSPPARPLLRVDTRTFDVDRPEQAATASSAISPWPLIGLALGCLILGLSWRLWGRRMTGRRSPAGRT